MSRHAPDTAIGWCEPPGVGAVLRAAGVAPATAVDSACLHDVSRSHVVTRATLPDGRSYVVKHVPREARAAGRSLTAELYVYRLASWRPDLAVIMPGCVHLDERRQVLTLEAAPVEHLFQARMHQRGFPGAEFSAALGRTLAALHTATADVPLVTVSNYGVVGLPDAPASERRLGDDSRAAQQLIEAVCSDERLAAALRRAAAALRPSCLIHGDVKWDNAIMNPGPPARVSLFDWELSGSGDPAWDVGSALADGVSLAARTGMPPQQLGAPERALLAAYGAARTVEADFADRVVCSWTARTIHLALESAAGIGDAQSPPVRALLDTARELDLQRTVLTKAVREALAAAP